MSSFSVLPPIEEKACVQATLYWTHGRQDMINCYGHYITFKTTLAGSKVHRTKTKKTITLHNKKKQLKKMTATEEIGSEHLRNIWLFPLIF